MRILLNGTSKLRKKRMNTCSARGHPDKSTKLVHSATTEADTTVKELISAQPEAMFPDYRASLISGRLPIQVRYDSGVDPLSNGVLDGILQMHKRRTMVSMLISKVGFSGGADFQCLSRSAISLFFRRRLQ